MQNTLLLYTHPNRLLHIYEAAALVYIRFIVCVIYMYLGHGGIMEHRQQPFQPRGGVETHNTSTHEVDDEHHLQHGTNNTKV